MSAIFARDRGWSNSYLSQAERESIEQEAQAYPQRDALCIEALRIVQQHRGWVSDDSVAAIADYLGLGAAQVDAVATFYNLIFRQPVGRQVIYLCNSVTCWMLGCDALRARIGEELGIDFGQTSDDGEYTLLPITCLGDCDHAPALMIGDRHHHDLEPDSLAVLLRRPAPDQATE
ncbi:NADH-quinone oxidoreductase subunit NuoE [Marinobacterium sedimentorum]|uniref:NADH-quinone oxidoreductase subunit NuoE n=1 Tax=Marinobacterium sedimentorum TaxID=2927804 RepID=UPI0020C6DB9F|nr:NADH-quinone oxidoreductase subunit NuoE [Marinobacterium sedimentorum]MCP8686195.1 NADH-quinone oxidoreductase subunit NuoE [Marinobacterium sedimentorum]